MNQQWLKCRVLKGMFSDERVVQVPTRGGDKLSFFVHKDKVEGDIDRDGRVRVDVLRREDMTVAFVPSEYPEAIAVRDEDLQPA